MGRGRSGSAQKRTQETVSTPPEKVRASGWKLTYDASFERDLDQLDRSVAKRVVRKAGLLARDPFPSGSKKLSGYEDIYRIRVGDYRIAYTVDTLTRTVNLSTVDNRDAIYKSLRRRTR